MERKPVDSTVFQSEGYDAERHILELEFKNDFAVWQYHEVSKRKYAAFKNAESLGNFFVTRIKGKHPETRIK